MLTRGQSDDSHTYALKVFRESRAYDAEIKAYRETASTGSPIDSLTRFYFSFTYRDLQCIVLEYADRGNLDQLMKAEKPPQHPSDVLALFRSLLELSQAADRVHKASG